MDYPVIIRPLSEEEGGGYIAAFPDLMGCMSDGETPEEALANARDALTEWMETNQRHGREIPAPGSAYAQADAAAQEDRHRLDDRIERVEADLVELREQIDHANSWLRFSKVTGVLPDDHQEGQARLPSC